MIESDPVLDLADLEVLGGGEQLTHNPTQTHKNCPFWFLSVSHSLVSLNFGY